MQCISMFFISIRKSFFVSLSDKSSLIYRPFSFLYLLLLLFTSLTIAGWFFSFFKGLLIDSIGIPQQYFWAIMILSWIGSNINLPLFVVESEEPVPQFETVRFFGRIYRIPKVNIDKKKTLVLINVGGAIVPTLISLYLFFISIPACADNLLTTYTNTFAVLFGVIFTTYQSAQLVKGVGITTLAWGPPTMTVFITMLINYFSPLSCPVQIAYIGGTMGALIGADLLNLSKITGIGPVVSIGGAGTFDGIYLSGLASVVLLLFLT